MTRAPVTSSTISSIGHDPATQTLEVEFKSGKVYRYQDVSAEKHAELLGAESIGKHFGAHIKPNHTCTAVEVQQ